MRTAVMLLCVFFCSALCAQTWDLDMEDGIDLILSQTEQVSIDVGWDGNDFAALQLAIGSPPAEIEILSIELGTEMLALNGGQGPDYFQYSGPWDCPANSFHWYNVGVIGDLFSPILNSDGEVLRVNIGAAPGAVAGSSSVQVFILSVLQACLNLNTGFTSQIQTVAVDIAGVEYFATVATSDTVADITILDAIFIRGDVDSSGDLNIADPIAILAALFTSAGPLMCDDAGDVSDDGTINIGDPIYLLQYLFNSGSPPPTPFGATECEEDPTSDVLDCANYTRC